MENNTWILVIVGLVIGVFAGYYVGNSAGYKRGSGEGYTQAQADIKKTEELAAQKASLEAAKTANPFQTVNPLSGVSTNPFEKAKKVLNPFQ